MMSAKEGQRTRRSTSGENKSGSTGNKSKKQKTLKPFGSVEDEKRQAWELARKRVKTLQEGSPGLGKTK